MPWTLYRYILREMLKLLVLSAGVLVIVISFAAAIRPLSDGVLGPWALLKFVAYTAPTMLGFALPFAGAFASTLVFLRMAGDNEITACSASGLSYFSILLPVTLLGATLTMSLFFMSNYVLPWFYREATQIVEEDLITALVRQLDKKQPYVLRREGYVIYADRADQVTLDEPPAAPGQPAPEKAIILHGVAVGELDAEGRIRSDITAHQARMVVFRDASSGASWVNMSFEEVMYYNDARGELLYTQMHNPRETIRIPSPFEDQVEFLSWPQLKHLRANPGGYDDVQRCTRDLVDAVAAETLMQSLLYGLLESPDRVLTLYGPRQGERFLIRAPRVARRQSTLFLSATERRPVTIERQREGQVDRHYEAAQVVLQVQEGTLVDEPTLGVTLYEAKVTDLLRGGVVTEHAEHAMPQMVWPALVLGVPRSEVGMEEALATAAQDRYQRDIPGYRVNPIITARRRLLEERSELLDRIAAQLHSRAASAIACTLLLLLGAVLSMKMKSQMALVVYFWSFLLAVVTLIIIHSGNNMVNSGSSLGGSLAVMWAGNVVLAVVVGWSYCQLARN